MNPGWFCCAAILASLAAFPGSAHGRNPTDEELKGVLQVSERAVASVAKHSGRALGDDSYFIETLRGFLMSRDLSDEEKAWAFYLMQKKIGWAFGGFVHIPAGFNYYKVFTSHAGFYYQVHRELRSLDYDVRPFLRIAKARYRDNVMLAANALLLGAVLNPSAARGDLYDFLDYEVLKGAQVPDILNHYLCLGVVFAMTPEAAEKLGRNLIRLPSEEAKEDVISVLGMYENRAGWEYIRGYVITESEPRRSQAVETGLFVLKRRLEREELDALSQSLRRDSSNPWKTRVLDRLTQSTFPGEFEDRKKGSWMKIWDPFSVGVFDNGILMSTDNNFKEFFPRRQ